MVQQNSDKNTWPDDVDGDVFRRMLQSGFDFSKAHVVDYNIDFKAWPPSDEALAQLRRSYESVTVYEPDGNLGGYVQVQLREVVTYARVIATQQNLTKAMALFGGVCESWGALQE